MKMTWLDRQMGICCHNVFVVIANLDQRAGSTIHPTQVSSMPDPVSTSTIPAAGPAARVPAQSFEQLPRACCGACSLPPLPYLLLVALC